MDSAEFFLGTVTAVRSADGIKIKLDGEDESMAKYYKMLVNGADWPTVGSRVVIMKHSGTYVVMGKIGTPNQNSGKVNRGGDTMTGLLNIERTSPGVIGKVTNRASEDTAEANINSCGFRIVDKNNNPVAIYTDRYETSGENGAIIGGYRMVDGTLYGNNLKILITPAGIPVVYVTSPAAWRKALQIGNSTGAFPLTVAQGGTGNTSVDTTPTAGSTKMVTSGGVKSALDGKVSDTGDTMTGDLTLESGKELHVKAAFKSNDTYASNQYGKQIVLFDSAGSSIGYLRNVHYSGGDETLDLIQRRTVNGESVYNSLQLVIGASGARAVQVTDAAAWRKALGLGTNGAFPITVAQGGTGATSAAGHAVFAGPNSSTAAAPSFRALVADDIPSLNASKITAGTLPIARGGTGSTGITADSTIASIITAATGFSITSAQFYSWGKVAMFVIAAKATADASTSGWHTIGNLVSGKRPAGSQIIRDLGGVSSVIYSDGRLNGYGSFNSGRTFEFTAIYLLP